MLVVTVVCLALCLATTFAKPYYLGQVEDKEKLIKAYAKLHPNKETEPNPEYGEYTEGDVLETKPTTNDQSKNAATGPAQLYWNSGIMHYTIKKEQYTTDEIRLIERGISDLVNLTKVNGKPCIQIIPRKWELDYVEVENGKGCSSYIGRVRKRQTLTLSSICVKKHGTIMHEFLHAFGFHHEQRRTDRDDWITINWENIHKGTENNFQKVPLTQINLLGTPYDYESVMHYDAYAFAINPKIPTIVPRDKNARIGQRVTLSRRDIERVQVYYGCIKQKDSRYFKDLDPLLIPDYIW